MIGRMRVQKLSVALEGSVVEEAKASAARSGTSLSAWLNDAARARLVVEDGLRAVAEWEAEHGALTRLEKKRADAALDRAGVRVSAPARRSRRAR